jgi:DNA-binding transcriptional regulator LsrR (DeoR family)
MFCEGEYTLAKIAKALNIGRERPYRLLQHEARLHRFQYAAPLAFEQAHSLGVRYPWLRPRVVHTVNRDDVASEAAHWLVELIDQHRKEKPEREDVHIGFAGGGLLSETARQLAHMLRERTEELRNFTFVFHALVAGFNPRNPFSDPNAFFTYFTDEPTLQVSFVNLLAPGFVTTTEWSALREFEAIKEAFRRAADLDILVTSAGAHWGKKCSRLRQLYNEQGLEETLEALEKAGTIGDLLWRPISKDGPVEVEAKMRALTVLDLPDLPQRIKAGCKVVLALGPCGSCRLPKGDILRTVLGWKQHYVTHAVVDSRTAQEALTGNGK